MEKVFVMYRLQPGVSFDEYCDWSRNADQRITPRQPACIRFEVYAIESASDGEARYQIVEEIEVESWEAWEETLANNEMRSLAASLAKYADPATVQTIHGRRIV